MKGYEQYGNRGEVVDNDDKVVGKYCTVGYNQVAVDIIDSALEVPSGGYVWTWKHFEDIVDMLDLHMVPEHN